MRSHPNKFQRGLLTIFMQRSVTAVITPVLHRVDGFFWKISAGRFFFSSKLVGIPALRITTIGAKSKQPRSLVLYGFSEHEKIALIASNFGQTNNPSWYYNLKANPKCQVEWKGRSAEYIAHEAAGEEYQKYWDMAVSYYKGYDLYKIRAAHRHIPVMILVPAK
ncbi:nitroreductase family deazaflavin-dependent oxidoreductase [Candidatus Villigracilis saccharophilus]|uniref:nitroreductase family deazaflavin-dependent oxidoreductase n=1 Tax=Candidatus Villigracilis saccharophilus TaxID=3140684 RepID=UPI003134CC67|nr:nitroreductase family deazaflavin-dependent oxidoreductase [Anaerolineales bacterium]